MRRATDGETSRSYFRSDRFFRSANDWFFSTREGPDQGPFNTQARAEEALKDYLRERAGVLASAWEMPGANH